MLLKHMHEPPPGLDLEDTFEALDERSGATIAHCAIYHKLCQELFPNRPLRVFMDIPDGEVPDALLGAAVARAREIATRSGVAARIFAQVSPEDSQRMAALSMFGFRDSDGLVRMRRELPAPDPGELPYGCVLVRDELDDPIEQKYFLERYNQLYSEHQSFDWLQEFRDKEGFGRTLIVSSKGMVGEIVHWRQDGAGTIGWLLVSRKWRRRGVSQLLIQLACAELYEAGALEAVADIQVRVPNLLHSMEKAGFKQSELLYRYPSIDI